MAVAKASLRSKEARVPRNPRQRASKRLGIPVHNDNEKAAQGADVVLLCVKPHQAEKVLREISGSLKKDQLLISICTGITTEQLSLWSGGEIPGRSGHAQYACPDRDGDDGFRTGPGRSIAAH